ncbi:hypothetical protein [Caproicibacter sp.]|uniref:hypothetical protein n=1 Tax=Caproicibacter sp. TaxID=2814884 RepID=UPI00398A0AB0
MPDDFGDHRGQRADFFGYDVRDAKGCRFFKRNRRNAPENCAETKAPNANESRSVLLLLRV